MCSALDAQRKCCYKGDMMMRNVCIAMASMVVPLVQAREESVRDVAAELRVGETQVLELQGNPTTGYSWMLPKPLPTDSPVRVEITYESARTQRALCGGGGVFKVQSTGLTPGKTTLELVYARPWEKGKTPHSRVNLTVTVK